MQLSRRSLLGSAAAGAAALSVAACGGNVQQDITNFEMSWSQFATQVQSLVSKGASYIPQIESIAATMAGLFGPAWQTAVQLGSAVLNQVVSALIAVVGNLSPPAVSARLRGTSPSAPGVVGVTPPLPYASSGIQVLGYR